MVDVLMVLQAVFVGAGVASAAAGFGYLKARFKPMEEGESPEAFSPFKFFEVVIFGAIFGGLAGGLGIDVLAAENYIVTLGVMPALSYWVPALAVAVVRGLRALKAKLFG